MFGRYRRRLPEIAVLLAAASLLASAVLAYALHKQQRTSDRKIVESGRVAIESGCTFDNQRAHAIRGILRRSYPALKAYYQAGQLSRGQYLTQVKNTRQAIREIVVRDCRHAALVLKR